MHFPVGCASIFTHDIRVRNPISPLECAGPCCWTATRAQVSTIDPPKFDGDTVMGLQNTEQPQARHSVTDPTTHDLHECRNASEFCERFAETIGHSVQYVIEQVIERDAPRAVFLTGSLPLGMATNGSDVDFVVLVDGKDALIQRGGRKIANTDQQLAFFNESDLLRAGLFLSVMNGVTVEVSVAVTPSIKLVYNRLRGRGPELSENEIMTLGRLSTGWLLTESDGYLQQRGVVLTNPALFIYCSTKHFSYALIYQMKAARALDLEDIPQALYLGRLSVEMAYLSYFASEGFPYLGAKWLAQLGHARTAAERVQRHPLLKEGIPILFPDGRSDSIQVRRYLQDASSLVTQMRTLIESKTLFRIAFHACPQIYPQK